MRDDDLPIYTEAEQGIDQDRDIHSPVTPRHLAWQKKLKQTRQLLTEELRNEALAPSQQTALEALEKQPRHPGRGKPAINDTDEAVIYARVSTREQASTGGRDEGYSIPFQREACRAKARDLGAVVVQEYIDAGESAKSMHRPHLQQMLKDIKKRRIRYLIVHKIDRLARSREDDMAIRLELARAGVELVSCTENITNTAHGRLIHNIMADMAEFYRENLANEVMKGLVGKVKDGGTPFRAPLGYLNKRELIDGVSVAWIEPDPKRAPILRWCFEQYATGEWTVTDIVLAARARGLTTRATRKRPEEPISLNTMFNMFHNPYYMGIIAYNGGHYPGSHEPLTDAATWLRIQDILAAHHHAGEKDRKHPHYLRGTIFCSSCGARLVYSRNRGNGGTYEYYLCLKKKLKANNCARGAVALSKIEDGIVAFYGRFRPAPKRLRDIQESVVSELKAQTADAHTATEQAQRHHSSLLDQRAKLMQAHYAGAVPVDVLKAEMERLTSALAAAETQLTTATAGLSEVEQTLQRALRAAERCPQWYGTAEPAIRRQINQGFFSKLYIGTDGEVDRYELTEPFQQLLDPHPLQRQRDAGRGELAKHQEPDQPTPPAETHDTPEGGSVFTRTVATARDLERNTAPDGVRRGVKEPYMVGEVGIEPTLF